MPITTSGPARFGTLFHAALERWWNAFELPPGERLAAAMMALHDHGAADEEEAVVAEELLLGYHLRWVDAELATESAEEEFDVPLINPASGRASRTFVLRGKIDAKVRDLNDGRRYLVEHKTTTADISEGSTYWQRLRIDGQVSVYYGAFPDVAGCIYDVIRRPTLKPKKATPPESLKFTKGKVCKACLNDPLKRDCVCGGTGWAEEPRPYADMRTLDETLEEFRERVRAAIADDPEGFYKRGIVVRLDTEIRENQFDLWQQANVMREMEREGIHPRNPDACIQYGRRCDYFDVCTGCASINDDRLYQLGAAHPELSPQEATS